MSSQVEVFLVLGMTMIFLNRLLDLYGIVFRNWILLKSSVLADSSDIRLGVGGRVAMLLLASKGGNADFPLCPLLLLCGRGTLLFLVELKFSLTVKPLCPSP